MVEGIKALKYGEYVQVDVQKKVDTNEEVVEIACLDRQEILNQVEEYTYANQSGYEIERNRCKSLKEPMNLQEEEIYELYKRGLDIEQLTIQEVAYHSMVSTKNSKQEESAEIEVKEKSAHEEKSTEQKIEVIKKQNDSMYLYTLTSKDPVTVNSLYEANFKGDFKKGIRQYTKDEVDRVLGMNGLAQTSGNNWAAGLLMMYDVGVSAQDVTKLQNMQSAIMALDIQEGGSLSDEDVLIKEQEVQYKPEYIDRITDDLGMVTDEHIEKLIEEGKEIHINELRESIHKKADQVIGDRKKEDFDQQNERETSDDETLSQILKNPTEQVEEIKKQIHQIRTKLTVEAAQKISGQMPLESSYLSEVASALQEIEQEEVVKALNIVQLPVTHENVDVISHVMAVTQDMSRYFMQTVQIEMDTDGQALLSDIQSALNAYHANETAVEKRFGETITKVEDQIKDLLESQNIEVSKVNIEAAKALVMNEMEVDETNVERLQEIVVKLTTFLEEMTPIQAAILIKEGINPYKASVDELLLWMGDYKIEGLKNSVAETIVVMEKEGQINEEQKQGMVGLYRILQGVSRQKEEIVGYLYKNNLPLTMENLQMAVYYAGGKKHIEIKVDDTFGELESLTYEKQRAKDLINESVEQSDKVLEKIKMLENMELPITEEGRHRMTKISAWLYPYIKEQFKKDLGQLEGMGTLPDSFLEKLESVKSIDAERVEYMVEQKVPLTLTNIYWVDQLAKEPGLYGSLLAHKGLLEEKIPSDLEELEEMLNQLESKVREQKEEATLTGELKEYKEYKQIEEIVHFQKERMEKEGLYQIPFMIEGERKLINLYFHKEEANSIEVGNTHFKAILTYQTKHLGEIKAYIELKGDVIGYKVEAETLSRTKALQSCEELLLQKLKRIGYNVQYSEFLSEKIEDSQQDQIYQKYQENLFEKMI